MLFIHEIAVFFLPIIIHCKLGLHLFFHQWGISRATVLLLLVYIRRYKSSQAKLRLTALSFSLNIFSRKTKNSTN